MSLYLTPSRTKEKRAWHVALFCTIAGIGLTLLFVSPFDSFSDRTETAFIVTPAVLQNGIPQQTPPQEPVNITLDMDATRTAPSVPLTSVIPGDLSQFLTPSKEMDTADYGANWLIWGRLKSDCATLKQTPPASTEAKSIRTFATRCEEGATLCIANSETRDAQTKIKIRLPQGVFKIERLTLPLNQPITPQTMSRHLQNAFGLHSATFRQVTTETTLRPILERLEGCNLAGTTSITKEVRVAPGTLCIVRFTDQARAVRAAYYETLRKLDALASSASGPARRMKAMLKEGEPYLSAVAGSAGKRGSSAKRLGCVHRLLLVTAQVQSLQRNLLERKVGNAEVGAVLMGTLEQMADALAETSATLLGLVPRITLSRTTTPATAPGEGPPPPPSQPNLSEIQITLALINAGTQSIQNVKIGLDTSALPEGVSTNQSEPAIFGTVRPGQTVRTVVRLRGPGLNTLPDAHCVGDISYVTANGAAHLRPRAW